MWKWAVRRGAAGTSRQPWRMIQWTKRREACVVAPVMPEHSKEEDGVLVDAVELLAKGLAGAEEVAFYLAIHLDDEGGLGLPVGVVAGEEIGEEAAILEDGVDGIAEEAGVAAEAADDVAVGHGEFANQEVFHRGPGIPVWRKVGSHQKSHRPSGA